MIMITDSLAAMAAVSHQLIAMIVAVLSMFSEIIGVLGLTAASTKWQDVFCWKLAEYLPSTDLENPSTSPPISPFSFCTLKTPPSRLVMQHTYGDVQEAMFIAATAVWVAGLVGVLMERNIRRGAGQGKCHLEEAFIGRRIEYVTVDRFLICRSLGRDGSASA